MMMTTRERERINNNISAVIIQLSRTENNEISLPANSPSKSGLIRLAPVFLDQISSDIRALESRERNLSTVSLAT